MTAKYHIGIDLGTTNSVLAFAPADEPEAMIAVLPIPQITAPGTVERRLSLPSFLLRMDGEPDPTFRMDGFRSPYGVVGEYARRVASEQPDRVIAAAKSWLCHSAVDRTSPLLPFENDTPELRLSPLEATTAYLMHLVDAWSQQFSDAPFHEQRVAITVPASFDLDARELTKQAAMTAGFPEDFVFLEEPQAALYNWIHAQGDNWRRQLKKDDSLLVCDVGGGTTDLTLVQVTEEAGELELSRLAVGKHLLVGGDNMDLTLAHVASQLFASKGHKLNAWQSTSLWHSCRLAKESLLHPKAPSSVPLNILGRGSKLIGGTISVDLERSIVESTLVDGFFPVVDLQDRPVESGETGFQEIGLPFEPDSAITKHVAAFLGDHLHKTPSQRISHLLFNGGVFNASPFRNRLVQTISNWNQSSEDALFVLGGVEDLDQAVACGAVYYLWAKDHGGIRIRGGTARSYYIGIESTGPAIPGIPRPLHALCVVPHGMEEGTECIIGSKEVGLRTGKKARFRFFSSTTRTADKPGQLLKEWDEGELTETPPMETELAATDTPGLVPVRFESRVTELGTLELYCKSSRSDDAWKLELQVRSPD
ncbi:Hsp70 family protein [Pirellulaceae bacterium SH449]